MSKKEEYEKMVEISDEIINLYRTNVKEKNKYRKEKGKEEIPINTWDYPPVANFSEKDFVINLMGINPSVDAENVDKCKQKVENNKLNLYFVYNKNRITRLYRYRHR